MGGKGLNGEVQRSHAEKKWRSGLVIHFFTLRAPQLNEIANSVCSPYWN